MPARKETVRVQVPMRIAMAIVLPVTTATSARAVERLKEAARAPTLTHIAMAVAPKASRAMQALVQVARAPKVKRAAMAAAPTANAALVPAALQETVLVRTDLARMLRHPRPESGAPLQPPARLCKTPAI